MIEELEKKKKQIKRIIVGKTVDYETNVNKQSPLELAKLKREITELKEQYARIEIETNLRKKGMKL